MDYKDKIPRGFFTGKPAWIRIAKLGHKVTEETREKIRVSLTGKKHGSYSIEHRAKISLALTGKVKSQETIEKHRKAITGRKQSPEEIAKRAAANTGKKRTPEQRKAISDGRNRHKGRLD